MGVKHVSDLTVVQAYAEFERLRKQWDKKSKLTYVDEILQAKTGQSQKVCHRAMERADRHGLVEYGLWLRGGWLTEKGRNLLKQGEAYEQG